ncbi:MAG TPA: AraC family transcriptional regulator [Actinobacteria bacterium]|jgi:AraC-like DNA-binding protein|nr:AraC family transcriptional regulator [Actinomycetota bacterium]
MIVATFPMGPGSVFDWHAHPDHQLAWSSSGVLTVRSEDSTWVLPPTRALWIPAGVPHQTLSSGSATMQTLYVRPAGCPISWPAPTPVAASLLLAELIAYLDSDTLDAQRRARGEAVLADLLEPVGLATIELRMPAGEPARRVAQALRANPADKRTLADWGREVAASGRTLERAFLADTGVPFARWRTLLRLRAALPALAAGEPVGNVARHVGYESTSAFVAAFSRETGTTPAAHFRRRAGATDPDTSRPASD